MKNYWHSSSPKVQSNCVLAWFLQKLDDKVFRAALHSLLAGLKIGGQYRLPYPELVQSGLCRLCRSGEKCVPSIDYVEVTILETPDKTCATEWQYSVSILLVTNQQSLPCERTTAHCVCRKPVVVTFGW